VIELLVYLVLAGLVLVVAIRIGMLVAPRITRLTERQDEDPRDDGPS
jgi:hypothetical protein